MSEINYPHGTPTNETWRELRRLYAQQHNVQARVDLACVRDWRRISDVERTGARGRAILLAFSGSESELTALAEIDR